jgi:ribosomal-protein-alanine N-acetyltransferase
LRRLQNLLAEPSPELLSFGLRAGTVLVTTADDSDVSPSTVTSPSSTPATVAPPSSTSATDVPVGYLLPIEGTGMHVAELVVAPAARREGRASALLATLLARLPDGERVTLSVAASNQAAQSLYRSFGFEQIGTSDTLYEDEQALLFERIV